jgi:magnesium and cobalt transporter
VDAKVNVHAFEERFGVTLPKEGYDTLGGFIIHLLGRVPKKGEEMNYEGLTMRIQAGDQKRITRILVTPPSEENSSATALGHSETRP